MTEEVKEEAPVAPKKTRAKRKPKEKPLREGARLIAKNTYIVTH